MCYKGSSEDLLKSGCELQRSSVVEDLFTKRKLCADDEDQLMTSRQIDDVIQVRCGSADDDSDDADDATVAKQPVMTSATVTNR